jgi:hypothetical protein
LNELQTAKLLAHAINTLGGQIEESELSYTEPCCWHECAPCDVLHDLLNARELTALVRPYVMLGGTWDWWTGSPEHGNVRLSWFMNRMCSATRCENRYQEGE